MVFSLRSMVPVSLFLTVVAIANTSPSKADDPGCPTQPVGVHNGFMTGVECSQLGELELKFLIQGFVSGLYASAFSGCFRTLSNAL
jgi:hypothetical protein